MQKHPLIAKFVTNTFCRFMFFYGIPSQFPSIPGGHFQLDQEGSSAKEVLVAAVCECFYRLSDGMSSGEDERGKR